MEAVLSNFSQSYFPSKAQSPKAMPYSQELSLALTVLAPMWPVIITFGLMSNITNIIVFLKAGVKENVTTLMLSLSISDLAFLILITPTMCGIFIMAYAKLYPWPFDFHFIYFMFYWPAFTAYDISAFISVSLGVMRCACVAMPLRFKLVFTKARTVKWVLFLVALAVGLRIPVLSIFRIVHITNPATNVSTLYLAEINKDAMSRINDVMNRGVVIWINYTTMITCVCILSFKLYQASKIRRSITAADPQHAGTSAEKTAPQTPLQSKDLQVIKSVVLVCTIFILSQLPFLVVSTYRLVESDFTVEARLHNLFSLFSQTSLTCSYLNASLNIFVYYNYNSKYRAVFQSLLSWGGGRDIKHNVAEKIRTA